VVKISAKGKDGRMVVVLGLSYRNLDKLRADGLNGFIKVQGHELGIDCDVLITSAETEAAIAEAFKDMIGPQTDVRISDKLKS